MTFSLSMTSLSVLFIITMKCMDCHLDFPLIDESQCAKCASCVGKSNVEIKQLMVCGWSASCFLCCSDWLFIYFRLYHSAIPVGWSMLTSLHLCAINVAIIIVRKYIPSGIYVADQLMQPLSPHCLVTCLQSRVSWSSWISGCKTRTNMVPF